MSIRVVLFDLDDTLFAHRKAVDDGIVAHLTASGLPSEDAVVSWHELEEQHYPRYLTGEVGFFEQRRIRSRALAEPLGVSLPTDHLADAWYDAYFLHYRDAWSLHDDALACLDALDARGLRIGLITNGDLGFQTEKLDRVALAARIEIVVASGELGVAKPDPAIFLHACSLFGVAPSEAMYVGDRLQTDAIGAASAGLAGVWLNRSGVTTAEEDAAVAASGVRVVTSLAGLTGLL